MDVAVEGTRPNAQSQAPFFSCSRAITAAHFLSVSIDREGDDAELDCTFEINHGDQTAIKVVWISGGGSVCGLPG